MGSWQKGENRIIVKALEVVQLTKGFGGVKAVDAISFTVYEGETVSIIGPNGAGKTTVFNLITQFYTPDAGTIHFYDHDISRARPYKLPRMGIGRTFQNLRLFANLTVMENVHAAALLKHGYNPLSGIFRTKRYRDAEARSLQKAQEVIDFLHLAGKEGMAANKLPYGEQRKLELARALSLEPKLMLIDEPAAGMNPKEIQDLNATIRAVKEVFKLTIVIIEHQMSLVMNISDRIIVMDFGEKIMEGTPGEVKKDKRVIEAYLGEELQ